MNHTAYLMVCMTTDPIPKFKSFFVTSEENVTTFGNEFFAKVLSAEGITPGDACTQLIRIVRNNPHFAWARPWVDPEFFDQRFALQNEADEARKPEQLTGIW